MARLRAGEFLDSMGAVSRCLRGAATEAYASLDLGATQGKFLRHIGRHGGISQAALARATQTDPALTGRALESLIERGWVRRKRSEEENRRQYVLELSAAGERARKKVDEARDRIAERIARALDDRDVDDFERIAKKILALFEGAAQD